MITIVMYHSISTASDPYAVSPAAFARQIQFVRDNYEIVPLNSIKLHLHPSGDRKLALTFDDGYADFLECAAPILHGHSVPATIFVPTAFVGRSNAWDVHLPHIAQRRIMSIEQLRMANRDALFHIGSHGVDHISMAQLSIADLDHQAVESRRFLEQALNVSVTMFSYPYGRWRDVSRRSRGVLRNAGYDIAVTSRWGTRNRERHSLALRRISLATSDDLGTVRAKIDGAHDWRALRRRAALILRSPMQSATCEVVA